MSAPISSSSARQAALAALIEPDPARKVALALVLRDDLHQGRVSIDPPISVQKPPNAALPGRPEKPELIPEIGRAHV